LFAFSISVQTPRRFPTSERNCTAADVLHATPMIPHWTVKHESGFNIDICCQLDVRCNPASIYPSHSLDLGEIHTDKPTRYTVYSCSLVRLTICNRVRLPVSPLPVP
jgi:hypothetical protein